MYKVAKLVLVSFVKWEIIVLYVFHFWIMTKAEMWHYKFNSQPEIRIYLAISFLQRLDCMVDNYDVKYETNNSMNNQ